jgi:acetyltransferase-like isoleucine patch superfamily enzyme
MRARVAFTRRRRRLPPGVVIGRHTYGYDERTFPMFTEGARVVVGAFCSISPEVRVIGGGEHVISRPSSFPLNTFLFDPAQRTALDAADTGATVVGNDVWIGMRAIVLSGVTIGDGAVVGAGAVVDSTVPAYAVVAGNPARVVRYRFDSEIRDRLLAIRWWDWDDQDIRRLEPWFMGDVTSFLDEIERRRKPSR